MYRQHHFPTALYPPTPPQNSINPLAESLFAPLDFQRPTALKNHNIRPKKSNPESFKAQLWKWFCELLVQDRKTASQVLNRDLIDLLISKFKTSQDWKYGLDFDGRQLRVDRCRPIVPLGHEQKISEEWLLSKARVMCVTTPCVYLSETALEEPESLLGHLEWISGHQIFQFPCRQSASESHDNPLWFSSRAFNTLAEWLCSAIESSITQAFFLHKKGVLATPTQGVVYGQQLSQYYASLSPEKRSSLRLQKVTINKMMELSLEQCTVEKIDSLCQIMGELEVAYNIQKSKEIDQIEEEATTVEVAKKPKNKKKKPKKKKNSNILDAAAEEEATGEIIDEVKAEVIEELQIEEVAQKIQEASVQGDPTVDITTQQVEQNVTTTRQQTLEYIEKEQQIEVLQTQEESGEEGKTAQHTAPHLAETQSTEESINSQQNKFRRRPRRKRKVSAQQVQQVYGIFLEGVVQKFVDELSMASNTLFEARVIVFERIRTLVMKLYGEYTMDAKLFGSNAAGLALPTSDIDILLTGFDIYTQQEIVETLEKVSQQLGRMKWVVKCECLLKAKVPIIKLEVDPSISFLAYKNSRDWIQELSSIGEDLEYKGVQCGTIKVDIAVEISNRARDVENLQLGCYSTEFMKSWLDVLPCLNPIVLILKHLLHCKGLNKPYRGGLSSYSLLIMAAAYLKEYCTESPMKVAQNLLSLLSFYGDQFQNQLVGISLFPNHPCYFTLPEIPSSKISVHDPLNGRLMTANCQMYDVIKRCFLQVREGMLQWRNQIEGDLQNIPSNQLKILLGKRKNIEKWLSRYEDSLATLLAN